MNRPRWSVLRSLAQIILCGGSFAMGSASADSIVWDFENPKEVLAVYNMEPGQMAHGRLTGQTAWDPHVSLRVDPEGIDAQKYTWLTVRMYSSTPADLLDVYYESPDTRWCLGGKFKVVQGWATYRFDLTKNHWRETATGDSSKQWGGPSRRVRSLRIDPGNQADRWVALDYVKLQDSEPGLTERAVVEPRGSAEAVIMEVPASVEAGNPIRVSARLQVSSLPQGLQQGTAYLQLRRDSTTFRLVEKPLAFSGETIRLEAELPTSAYWYPGPMVVETGCYELDVHGMGTREVAIRSDRVGKVKPAEAELRQVGGDPMIFLNRQPLPANAFVCEGGLHLDCHREISQAGIHLYCDWFGTSTFSDMGHVAPDRYDYSEYDRYFAAILGVDPQAYFIPHVGVTGPKWWQQAHPEEMTQFENGTKGATSFASLRWRQEMGDDLRRLIAYLRKSPYADRIMGYMFFNGYTAEWQMWGTHLASRDDYSEPAHRAFREFLTRRYGTDQRLQAAWGIPQVTLADAPMPDDSKRRPPGPQVLRDPRTERQAMDYYEFISHMDADAILYFARIVREATERKALVGTYYGYLTAHGLRQQDSGHLAVKRVFDSPDIDFLMSPPNYWYRKPGEACTFMSATDSFRLRGKLWWDESDHRTHLTPPGAGYGRAENLDQTRGVFWRELAEVLTKRAAVSWFDMGGGWFSDPQVLADLGRGHAIFHDSLAGRKPFAAEICVMVDPDSFYWMRPTQSNADLVLHQVATMPQSGSPWDFCLIDDIADPRLPDYKLYVFLNAFYVDPPRREAIHARLRRNGATGLFVYAPGYFGPDGPSLAGMQALTGIRLAKDDTPARPQILLEANDPLARDLDVQQPIGTNRLKLSVAPIFYADDPDARVAGRIAGSTRPGLVVKSMDGWTSVYCGAMHITQGLMRNLARSAGVHIWIDTDDALYADNRFVGLHAAKAGIKTIHLPADYRVVDALAQKPVATKGRTLRLELQSAETRLLQLLPGK